MPCWILLLCALFVGIDGVAIVMDVEDYFGISIQNSDAEHICTVGDLVTLVLNRMTAAYLLTDLIYCSRGTDFRKISV